MTTAGERFAQAVAAKDGTALRTALAGEIDFQALTPGRTWQAATATQVADDIVFGRWFGDDAEIIELCSVVPGQVADRGHVSYRFAAGWPAPGSRFPSWRRCARRGGWRSFGR